MRPGRLALAIVLLATPGVAGAEVRLPPGFTARVYVTGDGFDASARGVSGVPSASTLAFDDAGVLYLARTGRRYVGGEADGLTTVYRIQPGGARMTPESEARYFYGPPLWNPLVAGVRAGRELLVTTFDRERRIGVLYRVLDGRAELFAGGTPEPGQPPLLRQPEGAAVDRAGRVYVADRERGAIVRLDPAGRVLDPQWVTLRRPRALAIDDHDRLWVGADADAEAPWQRGTGELWRVSPDGAPTLVLRGPIAAGLALSPGGRLFLADRHNARVVVVTDEGATVPFLTFGEGDSPRGLAFAPVTPETRRLGIAGDLFVVTISQNAWPVNEIVRVSGPFDGLGGRAAGGR